MEFKHAYYDVTVQDISHYAIGDIPPPPPLLVMYLKSGRKGILTFKKLWEYYFSIWVQLNEAKELYSVTPYESCLCVNVEDGERSYGEFCSTSWTF